MKRFNRIPKVTNKIVLIELARAHTMIVVLSLACIMLTFLGVLYDAISNTLGAIIIVLLLNVGLFSFMVAVTSYKRAKQLKK